MPTLTDRDTIRRLYESSGKIGDENVQYYEEHSEEIKESHAGELVAIIDGSIAGTLEYTDDLAQMKEFIAGLAEEYSEEEVRSAYIVRVPDPDEMMLF